MLTSKQRAQLRAMANGMETIFQIGKGGLSDEISHQIDNALTARELIKVCTLETCPVPVKEAAQTIADAVGADVVQVVGRRFVLYRPHPEKPVIVLVK